MSKPKKTDDDHYQLYFIQLKSNGKWLTEKCIGHDLTRDPNEALGFSTYESAEDYINDLYDADDYVVTGHEFTYIK